MAITRLELRRSILINLNDLVNETTVTGQRYPNSYVNNVIYRVVRYYADKLDAYYQGYLSTNFELDVTANTRTYELPADFRTPVYKVRRTVNNIEYPIYKFENYLYATTDYPIVNSVWFPRYWIEGRTVYFDSPPQSDEDSAFVFKYPKKIVDFADDDEELDDELYDAEDCIILRATMRLLRGKDVSGALKNADGWGKELDDADRNFFQQVGTRYVQPDSPIPCGDYDGYDMYGYNT